METLEEGFVSTKPVQPVAILWDIENCCVPNGVNAENVAGNIRMALRVHPAVKGPVTMFSAYGDFKHFTRRLREGCQQTGVNLIDVPNGKKDAADKAILVDMFLFALDNPPPCTILLISGDVDFAPALHKLGQRGYNMVLAIPSGVSTSSALCSASQFVWNWPSVARGEGLVPAKAFSAHVVGEDKLAGYTTDVVHDPKDGSHDHTEAKHHAFSNPMVGPSCSRLFVTGEESTKLPVGVGMGIPPTDKRLLMNQYPIQTPGVVPPTDKRLLMNQYPIQTPGLGNHPQFFPPFNLTYPTTTQGPVHDPITSSQNIHAGGRQSMVAMCQICHASATIAAPSTKNASVGLGMQPKNMKKPKKQQKILLQPTKKKKKKKKQSLFRHNAYGRL